ncbi:hypothetical protein BQ8794_200012 [Mesorhizobium prunaredense]|uniref:Uncharacterized protein n=1 Tax=Mesorhizobium prunaredense TaxID=1631249 RepID=A0A1R3V6Z5_9HYPH|nr:hypothetical protein BQ8794_200012 [Mesorhizobium prunaredense]
MRLWLSYFIFHSSPSRPILVHLSGSEVPDME